MTLMTKLMSHTQVACRQRCACWHFCSQASSSVWIDKVRFCSGVWLQISLPWPAMRLCKGGPCQLTSLFSVLGASGHTPTVFTHACPSVYLLHARVSRCTLLSLSSVVRGTFASCSCLQCESQHDTPKQAMHDKELTSA